MHEVQPPEAVAGALAATAASVWRHAEGSPPVFLGMATHLGDGLFAAVADHFSVEGSSRLAVSDVRMRLVDGRVARAAWVCLGQPRPVVLIKAEGASRPAWPSAEMAALVGSGRDKVWRLGYCHGVFAEPEPAGAPRVTEGWHCGIPSVSWFRNGADPLGEASALVVHCVFGYPGRYDLGAPVISSDGLLAGVLIGGDLGPDARHQGAYAPIETVLPFARMAAAALAVRETQFSLSQQRVVHHDG